MAGRTLTDAEGFYGLALADAIIAMKLVLEKAVGVHEACLSDETRYRSQVVTIAEMLTALSDLRNELYNGKSKEEK